MLDNIILLNTQEKLVDAYSKINLEEDIVVCFPENTNEKLHFDYSGNIHYCYGELSNLSNIKQANSSSLFRSWKLFPTFKLSVPFGVSPLILKSTSLKYFFDIGFNYKSFIGMNYDEKTIPIKMRKSLTRNYIVYQNFEIVISYELNILKQLNPTMIISPTDYIFDLLLIKTIFSKDYYNKIYIINNNEFYINFKESI